MFQYVDTQAGLDDLVASCEDRTVLAIDTEFARSHTYYPEVGLIQVYNGSTCFLVDPLALEDLGPLAMLLGDASKLKLFHACGEDLEVFLYALNVVPGPIFDTQVGAAVLGVGFSMSYQNLVSHFLGLTIPKEQTRSDWLQRPLSAAQLDYAALDVIHLYEVYEKQRGLLESEDKLGWVMEECGHFGDDISINQDPSLVYQRIKSGSRLSPRELNVLREVCAWREVKARAHNVPRNRIVDEKSLVALSRLPSPDKNALADVGFSHRQVRKFGDELIRAATLAREAPSASYPPPMEDTRSLADKSARLKRLKEVVEARAAELRVAPEMLARRRHLEQLLRTEDGEGGFELPAPLRGWRRDAIGEHLIAALQDDAS
ncbi:MAG: ribonuclease D [Pseudomonadales bacterium]|nr:ribonuclease D [Pseudomonadales bacterium]